MNDTAPPPIPHDDEPDLVAARFTHYVIPDKSESELLAEIAAGRRRKSRIPTNREIEQFCAEQDAEARATAAVRVGLQCRARTPRSTRRARPAKTSASASDGSSSEPPGRRWSDARGVAP